jgi:hypothetical protein
MVWALLRAAAEAAPRATARPNSPAPLRSIAADFYNGTERTLFSKKPFVAHEVFWGFYG